MLKYFLIELMTPIVCAVIFYFLTNYALTKNNKRGWVWGILFTILAFAIMAFAWKHAGDYSQQLQCMAAYGVIEINPAICDKPDDGINALIQTPILLTVWVTLSAFAIIRFRPSNVKFF